MKAAPAEVAEKVEKLVERERQLEKEIADLKRQVAMGGGGGGGRGHRRDARAARATCPGGKALAVKVDVGDAATLREMAEKLRDKLGDAVVLVGAPGKDKAMLVLDRVEGPDGPLQGGRAHQGHRADARRLAAAGGPTWRRPGARTSTKLDEALESLYARLA